VFLLSTALTWAVMLLGRLPKHKEMNAWARRAVQFGVGLGLGALAFWLDGWALPTGNAHATTQDLVLFGHRFTPPLLATSLQYLFYFGLTVALCRWWKATDRKRRQRVRFLPVVAAGFWGVVLLLLCPHTNSVLMLMDISVLVIAAVAVQVASPWAPPPTLPTRNRR
jgi:hypothetical protein